MVAMGDLLGSKARPEGAGGKDGLHCPPAKSVPTSHSAIRVSVSVCFSGLLLPLSGNGMVMPMAGSGLEEGPGEPFVRVRRYGHNGCLKAPVPAEAEWLFSMFIVGRDGLSDVVEVRVTKTQRKAHVCVVEECVYGLSSAPRQSPDEPLHLWPGLQTL